MCRRSEVSNCGRLKSNSSDTYSAKGVITEDSDVCRSNKLACVFGVIPSIPQQSADRQEWSAWDLWRDGKAVIWILEQAGTRRWRKKDKHLIYLFIYAVHRQNSRGMLREAKGDGGVKTDRCDVITVEVALVWHFYQMFGSFLYKPDYCTRSHLHILLSAWITVKLFSNLQIRLPYQMTKFMIWSLNPNSDWKKKASYRE